MDDQPDKSMDSGDIEKPKTFLDPDYFKKPMTDAVNFLDEDPSQRVEGKNKGEGSCFYLGEATWTDEVQGYVSPMFASNNEDILDDDFSDEDSDEQSLGTLTTSDFFDDAAQPEDIRPEESDGSIESLLDDTFSDKENSPREKRLLRISKKEAEAIQKDPDSQESRGVTQRMLTFAEEGAQDEAHIKNIADMDATFQSGEYSIQDPIVQNALSIIRSKKFKAEFKLTASGRKYFKQAVIFGDIQNPDSNVYQERYKPMHPSDFSKGDSLNERIRDLESGIGLKLSKLVYKLSVKHYAEELLSEKTHKWFYRSGEESCVGVRTEDLLAEFRYDSEGKPSFASVAAINEMYHGWPISSQLIRSLMERVGVSEEDLAQQWDYPVGRIAKSLATNGYEPGFVDSATNKRKMGFYDLVVKEFELGNTRMLIERMLTGKIEHADAPALFDFYEKIPREIRALEEVVEAPTTETRSVEEHGSASNTEEVKAEYFLSEQETVEQQPVEASSVSETVEESQGISLDYQTNQETQSQQPEITESEIPDPIVVPKSQEEQSQETVVPEKVDSTPVSQTPALKPKIQKVHIQTAEKFPTLYDIRKHAGEIVSEDLYCLQQQDNKVYLSVFLPSKSRPGFTAISETNPDYVTFVASLDHNVEACLSDGRIPARKFAGALFTSRKVNQTYQDVLFAILESNADEFESAIAKLAYTSSPEYQFSWYAEAEYDLKTENKSFDVLLDKQKGVVHFKSEMFKETSKSVEYGRPLVSIHPVGMKGLPSFFTGNYKKLVTKR